jgi:hypothetical protein
VSKRNAPSASITTDKQGQANKRLRLSGIADTIETRQAAYLRTVSSHDLARILDAEDPPALQRLNKGRGDSTVSDKDGGNWP